MIVVDFELSARQRRTLAGALASCLVVGVAAVAYAGPLHAWIPGDTLTAADLNNNFSGLDARVAALEAKTPTTLVSEATTKESGTTSTDLVYQSTKLDLTAGTWLVQGTAAVTTTVGADGVQIGLWDDGASAEVAQSRSPIANTGSAGFTCDGISTFCDLQALATTSIVTLTASTTLRLKAYRNGASAVVVSQQGSATTLVPAVRLTALRIK